jgi:hypothetical protein
VSESAETLDTLADDVRRFVERTRRALDDEIRRYPTPIPRCDAQFNAIYEQRARIARELDVDGADPHALLRAFARSQPLGDTDEERALRSRSAAAVGEP